MIWNSDLRRSNGKAGKAVIQKPRTAQNYAVGSFGNFNREGPFPGPQGHIEGIGKPLLSPESLYKAQLQARMKGIAPVFPDPVFTESPTKDIFDYPLLFRKKLFLEEQDRSFGGYTIYNEKGEKVEENEKGPSHGIGEKLPPGIYTLNIIVDGRSVERKLIKQEVEILSPYK